MFLVNWPHYQLNPHLGQLTPLLGQLTPLLGQLTQRLGQLAPLSKSTCPTFKVN